MGLPRLIVSIPNASPDGKFYGRYPNATARVGPGYYASGHYTTGPFPFATTPQAQLQIHPRPDSERSAYSLYSLAYYNPATKIGMPYQRPVCLRGGSPPHVFVLMAGPPGMIMKAGNWQPGWEIADAIAAGYGDVYWVPDRVGTWKVWVRAFDQESTGSAPSFIDITWTVSTIAGYDATNQLGYVFLDPVHGVDPPSYPTSGVIDTYSAPIQSLEWAFGPNHATSVTYPNAVLVILSGTVPAFAQDRFYGLNFNAGFGPTALLGWPGASPAPTLDLTNAGVNRGFDINNNTHDFALGMLSMANGPSGLSVTLQPAGTLTDGTYVGVALATLTGAGTGASATVVVSGGEVTSVTEALGGTGSGFKQGDTVSIPASAIRGATSDGIATVMSVVLGAIATNFSQVKSINFFHRGLLFYVSCPNESVGTYPDDNCGLFDLDDPGGSPRQYMWMKGCTVTNMTEVGAANAFGMFDWFKVQYGGAELCSVQGANAGASSSYFQKGAVSDTTLRFCEGFGQSGFGNTGDQWNGWLSGNGEICYCTFDRGATGGFSPQINMQFAGGGLGGLGVTGVSHVGVTTASTLAAGPYYYVVTARLYNGYETQPDTTINVTTTATDPSTKFSWGSLEGASNGYRLYRDVNPDFSTAVYYDVAGTTFTDTGATPDGSGAPPTASSPNAAPAFGLYVIYRCSLGQAIDVNNPQNPSNSGPLQVIDCAIEWGSDNSQPIYINRGTGALPPNVTNVGTEVQAQSGIFNDPSNGDYSFTAAYSAFTGLRGARLS